MGWDTAQKQLLVCPEEMRVEEDSVDGCLVGEADSKQG